MKPLVLGIFRLNKIIYMFFGFNRFDYDDFFITTKFLRNLVILFFSFNLNMVFFLPLNFENVN